jgi:hypothetical protein
LEESVLEARNYSLQVSGTTMTRGTVSFREAIPHFPSLSLFRNFRTSASGFFQFPGLTCHVEGPLPIIMTMNHIPQTRCYDVNANILAKRCWLRCSFHPIERAQTRPSATRKDCIFSDKETTALDLPPIHTKILPEQSPKCLRLQRASPVSHHESKTTDLSLRMRDLRSLPPHQCYALIRSPSADPQLELSWIAMSTMVRQPILYA